MIKEKKGFYESVWNNVWLCLGEGTLCLGPVKITAVGLLLRDWQSWVCLDNSQPSEHLLEWTQLCALGIAGDKLP